MVGIPSWRLDCEREIDVIEEVARLWGYRRIERSYGSFSRSLKLPDGVDGDAVAASPHLHCRSGRPSIGSPPSR